MTTPMSDKEQVEMIKQWWKDYGQAIAAAIVIGLLFGFGWRYWSFYHTKQNLHASLVYQDMIFADASKNLAQAQNDATQLMNHYSATPYASFAALLLAKELVTQNQFDSAYQQLAWVFQEGKIASIRQIARLRAARILLAQNKFDPAMHLILTQDDPAFAPLISSIKGDIYTAKGDLIAAKQAYQIAQAGLSAIGTPDPILQMKLAQ